MRELGFFVAGVAALVVARFPTPVFVGICYADTYIVLRLGVWVDGARGEGGCPGGLVRGRVKRLPW